MTLKALIFDVDGTLTNTEKNGHLPAFNRAFRHFELDWIWSNELYHHLLNVSGGKERLRFYINNYHPDLGNNNDNVEDLVGKIHRQKTEYFVNWLAGGEASLRVGISRLLNEALDAGLQIAIATTTSKVNVYALIEATLGSDFLAKFTAFATGDLVKNQKPSSEVYDLVLQKMQLKANEVIAFEDSSNGILAASGAGIKTIITVNEYTVNQDFEGAMAVLDNLGNRGRPFQLIAGDKTAKTYVDIDYLKELYEKHCC